MVIFHCYVSSPEDSSSLFDATNTILEPQVVVQTNQWQEVYMTYAFEATLCSDQPQATGGNWTSMELPSTCSESINPTTCHPN